MKKLLFLILLTIPLLFLNLTGFTQNLPSYVPTNGLVGFWTMNGTHLDSSPNQNPTTNYGVTFGGYRDNPNNQVGIWNPDTNCNSGLVVTQLDTSGMYDGFTLSFWVKQDSLQFCYGPRMLTWGGIQFYPTGGETSPNTNGFVIQHFGQSTGMSTTISNDMKNWNNIVYTFGVDSVRLYLNSSLVWVTNNQHPYPNSFVGPGLHFGLNWYNDPNYPGSFNGQLDDIGIWNRVLDITEIGNLYGGSCQVYDTITILDTIRYSVTDTLYIDVNLTSTIPLVFENTIKVYPNPTKDFLQIDCGDISTMNGYSIKIINSLSQSLFDEPVTQSPISIDMNGWNGNGLYFLHLIDGSGNITDIRKIVLQ